jgi:predicted permease
MFNLRQDLRYGGRMLAKSPGFTMIAAISLALGIGATTAIFSLVDKLLVKFLPIERPAQLVSVEADTVNPAFHNSILSYADYADYRDQNQVFSGMIAYNQYEAMLGQGAEAEKQTVELISGNYFNVIGVRAALGRMIGPEEDQTPDAHPVAVLSDGLWRRRFGADAGVIGKTIMLNGATYTVVGVAPRTFRGLLLERAADLWIPMMMRGQLTSTPFSLTDRQAIWLRIAARLKDGVSIGEAQTSLDGLARAIWEAHTPPAERHAPFSEKRISLAPAGKGISYLRNQLDRPLRLLLAVTFLVLLIACANTATLLLGRATTRRKEIAVRLALGASRVQIIRQLLAESLILATIGGAAGLLVASWFYDLLLSYQSANIITQPIFQSGIDRRALIFAIIASLFSGIAFGLIPALQCSRPDLIPALKESELQMGGRERRWSARRILVVVQVTLAVVVLVGAGLFVRSLRHLFAIDPGFRAHNVLLVPIELPSKKYVKDQSTEFFRELTSRLEARPNIEAVSTAMITPFSGSTAERSVLIEGHQTRHGENISLGYNKIGLGYHRLLGIPIVRGRDFLPEDHARAQGVIVVNEAMARTYFPDQDPIGKRISYGPGTPWLEIVGVTRDVKLSHVIETPEPAFEVLSQQRAYSNFAVLLVRTRTNPLDLLVSVRREVAALEPAATIPAARTIEKDLLASLSDARMATTLTTTLGLAALALAVIGLYGVTSYAVTQRTREIGIRMALGASRRDVISLVLGQGMKISLVGSGIGLLLAAVFSRVLGNMLYGVSARDPLVFIGVAALLAVVALIAAYLPARRATRVDPLIALRCE